MRGFVGHREEPEALLVGAEEMPVGLGEAAATCVHRDPASRGGELSWWGGFSCLPSGGLVPEPGFEGLFVY